jgi:hypothetical protein
MLEAWYCPSGIGKLNIETQGIPQNNILYLVAFETSYSVLSYN